MEPTLTDARIVLCAPESIDPESPDTTRRVARWHTVKVVLGLVAATVLFQQLLGALLTSILGV